MAVQTAMEPWLETIGIVLVALAGVALAMAVSRAHKWFQVACYILPLAIICILLLVRLDESLAFVRPFSWIAGGRLRFVFVSLAVTLGLLIPLRQLPHNWEKVVVAVFMVAVVGWFSVMPFLMPALVRGRLAGLSTTINAEGICLQSTRYTCGPAAAVTALVSLGIDAHEGELAMLAHTNPVTGTVPGHLSAVLQRTYRPQGLQCSYRHFNSISELADAGLTLVVIRDNPMQDHCVTVLAVSQEAVTVADPMVGKTNIAREQFERMWRFSGIVITRGDDPI